MNKEEIKKMIESLEKKLETAKDADTRPVAERAGEITGKALSTTMSIAKDFIKGFKSGRK